VQDLALVVFDPIDVRPLPSVQDTRSAEENITLIFLHFTRGFNLDLPFSFSFVPDCLTDLTIVRDILLNFVFLSYALDVFQNLRSAGEEAAPLGVVLEGVLIDVGRDITSEAGISVLEPGPAECRVLLIDREVDPWNVLL